MTSDLDPIATSDAILNSYRRYLRSTFGPRREELAQGFDDALRSFQLTKGPFLQASPPYETGASLGRLVDEGVLAAGFDRLSSVFPATRPLYVHQEEAIRKAVAGRNLLIATGTGSGKTECFLFPVLHHLLREGEAGTLAQPGVRALLLYPMNALANDQVKRIRELFAPFPEVTFGRYVGDTKDKRADALDSYRQRFGCEPLPNELICRQEMQEQPPHILLTNYAMLEYLLLRPADSSFFDGPTGRHWRFLILDEVHVYDGARGAELGMLLRRVKDRVHRSETGKLLCIGTSATLGGGDDSLPRLTGFGETIFGEHFGWDPFDPLEQDVVRPVRRPLASMPSEYAIAGHEFPHLRDIVRRGDIGAVADTLKALNPRLPLPGPSEELPAYLWRALSREQHVVSAQTALERQSDDVTRLAHEVFGDVGNVQHLVALIDLAIMARPSQNDAPLIPARYHLLVRALEGAFSCLSPEHPAGSNRVTLARHTTCSDCLDEGRSTPVFELGVCRRCGADYILGKEEEGLLVQATPFDWDLRYLLVEEPVDGEDEDEAAMEGELPERADRRFLCTGCGAISDHPQLSCCDRPSPLAVTITAPSPGSIDLRKCLACGGRSNGSIVYRFITGADAPVSVVATSLYQSLPESAAPEQRAKVGGGRKLLSFADSRQDAAFFAPYLERTYGRAVERRLIWQYLSRGHEEEPLLDDMVRPIRRAAEDTLVLDPDASGPSKDARVRSWLMREVLATDRRQSLEGVGLAEVTVALPRGLVAPAPLASLGFTDAEAGELGRILLDTVRLSGAVSLPEDVDIKDPIFAPRNVVTVIREQGSEYGVLAWLPSKGSNRRLGYLERLLAARGLSADASELLAGLWKWMTDPNGPWRRVLQPINHKRYGTVYALNPERLQLVPIGDAHPAYRCDSCHQVWWRSLNGVCQTYKCTGSLIAVDPAEFKADHYRSLYTELDAVGMRVEEHTGQLAADYAGELQEEFIRGDVNVLSCSTTFELGVDVGEVQAVLMRNVPPRPSNYVQRAGRAGRRLGAAALVVTYAQRRNHDLHFFDQPRELIDGVVAPPIVTVENLPIVRRHMHAVAFAAFERASVARGEDAHKLVEHFFEPAGTSACEQFLEWLSGKPSELGAALGRIVPPSLAADLGVNDWRWVARLTEGADEGFGWLGRARDEIRGDLAEVRAQIEQAKEDDQLRYAAALQDLVRTLSRRQLIDFLAQRVVLPKYGFPVDVVSLDVDRDGDRDAANLELQRDLRTAIVEYAPGSQLVAKKALWEPTGLRKPPGRALLQRRWSECPECGHFATWLGERPDGCPRCGLNTPKETKGRSFIQPVFGFLGRRSDDKPGESRPLKAGYADSFFDDYAGAEPPFEPLDIGGGGVVQVRSSRQGRITVINRGRRGAGFQVCRSCGAAKEAGPVPKGVPKPHAKPFNKNSACTGAMEFTHLGHQYLTDVVELLLPSPQPMSADAAWSVLYAVIHGARAIGITPSDIDGTVRRVLGGDFSLVIFDAVPGGAGHALHIASHLAEALMAAHSVVEQCECGDDTSCYSCLRSYNNQNKHEQLRRDSAIAVLQGVIRP